MRCLPRWIGYRGVTQDGPTSINRRGIFMSFPSLSVITTLQDIVGYLTSTEFVTNIVATAIVVFLVIIFYRVAVRLIPRILQWRSPYSSSRDAAVRSRIKHLRYITFAIGTIVVASIFVRDLLPGIPVAILLVFLAADIMSGFIRR